MRSLIKILKGVLIGISVVIPGVSGGSMAVSMGIYDQLIDFFTVSRTTGKKNIALLPYGIGVLIGVAIFSYFIELMFLHFPLQTAFLFVGLILGALPMLYKRIRGERFRVSHALLLISTIALMVLLPIASRNSGDPLTLTPDFLHVLLAIGLGLSAAATMVIPGLSGSMLLVVLGYYEPVLHYVNSFTGSLFRFNFPGLLEPMIILVPFTVGALLGIVIMARLIRAMLKRFPYSTYYTIIGLVTASPFMVLYQQNFAGTNAFTYLLLAVLTGVGFLITLVLGKGE